MIGSHMSDESFFTFNLGKGLFSLPVKYVKEVFDFESITPIPNSLDYLKGVMNVRGSVVSIADFRKLFGFECSDKLEGTQIIILEIPQRNEKPVLLGIIADKVDVAMIVEKLEPEAMEKVQSYISQVRRAPTHLTTIYSGNFCN